MAEVATVCRGPPANSIDAWNKRATRLEKGVPFSLLFLHNEREKAERGTPCNEVEARSAFLSPGPDINAITA